MRRRSTCFLVGPALLCGFIAAPLDTDDRCPCLATGDFVRVEGKFFAGGSGGSPAVMATGESYELSTTEVKSSTDSKKYTLKIAPWEALSGEFSGTVTESSGMVRENITDNIIVYYHDFVVTRTDGRCRVYSSGSCQSQTATGCSAVVEFKVDFQQARRNGSSLTLGVACNPANTDFLTFPYAPSAMQLLDRLSKPEDNKPMSVNIGPIDCGASKTVMISSMDVLHHPGSNRWYNFFDWGYKLQCGSCIGEER